MKVVFRYFGVAILAAMLFAGCNSSDVDDDDIDIETEVVDDPAGVTQWIDSTLSETYLYNEEYNTLQNKDYALSYSNFLKINLTSLTTNVLDYKPDSEGEKHLYSYITRTDNTASTSLATRAKSSSKYMATDLGFAAIALVQDAAGSIGFYVLAVYNNSPVGSVGIRRGNVIREINGVEVTLDNYYDYWTYLYYPTAGDKVQLKCYEKDSEGSGGFKTLSVTVSSYEANPVLISEIIDEDAAVGKIGYLNYVLFESSYDTELLEAIKTLNSEGADVLMLDLRYNLGGYVSSASKLVSAIADRSVGNGEVFQYYRFNDDMTDDYISTQSSGGVIFDSSKGYFYENLYGVSDSYKLGLTNKTIYCLVGENTASASEMVITSLRAMSDYNVVTIGETTRGKNVGMFVHEKSFDNFDYELAPITFENFNKNFNADINNGSYESGITPDHYVPAFGEEMGFYDFSTDEYLIKNVLALIKTGSTLYDSGSQDGDSQSIASRSGATQTLSPISGKSVESARLQGSYKLVQ